MTHTFKAEIWKYPGKGGWHFVSLPLSVTQSIRELFKDEEEGWGRLKANAQVNEKSWDTAIWFDKKKGTYLLPIKAEIRKKENLHEYQTIEVTLNFDLSTFFN